MTAFLQCVVEAVPSEVKSEWTPCEVVYSFCKAMGLETTGSFVAGSQTKTYDFDRETH